MVTNLTCEKTLLGQNGLCYVMVEIKRWQKNNKKHDKKFLYHENSALPSQKLQINQFN